MYPWLYHFDKGTPLIDPFPSPSNPPLTVLHQRFPSSVLERRINCIVCYVHVCVWLPLLNIMSLRSRLLPPSAIHSFLLLSPNPTI